MRYSIAIAALGLICVALGSSLHAAEPPKSDPSKAPRRVGLETPEQASAVHSSRSKLDIAPGTQPAAAPAAAVLTFDQLAEMLDNMGYEPKVNNYNDGAKSATVNIKRGTWSFVFTFETNASSNVIWIRAYLGDWKEAQLANGPRLLKLIELSHSYWPTYFTFFSGKMLYIETPVANSGVKPALMRTTVENFMTTIQSTQDAWDTSLWTDAAAAPAPASK